MKDLEEWIEKHSVVEGIKMGRLLDERQGDAREVLKSLLYKLPSVHEKQVDQVLANVSRDEFLLHASLIDQLKERDTN